MIQAVHDGQFDIGMDGITINPERAEQIDFSDAYLTSQQFMLVRADEDRFTDAKSFAADPNLLIGAQAGTTNFYVAVSAVLDGDEKNPRIKLFDTFGASVQALKSGDVDTVLMDQSSANGYIGANPGAFKVVGDPLGTESFGFILTKGSDLLDPVNAALATIVADGTLDKLTEKWFYQYNAAQ
jgi:polar amino acid transport system substrate-binding protein